jgi:hypothetical protein
MTLIRDMAHFSLDSDGGIILELLQTGTIRIKRVVAVQGGGAVELSTGLQC